MSVSFRPPEVFGETPQEIAELIVRGLLYLQREASQAELEDLADILALTIEDCLTPSPDNGGGATRQ